MPGLYVQFGLVWSGIACFALVGLLFGYVRLRNRRRSRTYAKALREWNLKRPSVERPDYGTDEYDLYRQWEYTKPREYHPSYGEDEGKAIIAVLVAAIGIILIIVSAIIPATRNYDERNCGRQSAALGRETKFVVYGGGWSWDCLVRSRDGQFIPVDSLTEIRGDIVTHEGTPDNG